MMLILEVWVMGVKVFTQSLALLKEFEGLSECKLNGVRGVPHIVNDHVQKEL